jgi:hypothetical protein
MIGLFAYYQNPAAATPADDATLVPCPATAARLVLFHSGAVTLNGVEIGMHQLGLAIAALKPPPSEVCYAQEYSVYQSVDMGSALEVLVFAKMPISLYTDITFSRRIAKIGGTSTN